MTTVVLSESVSQSVVITDFQSLKEAVNSTIGRDDVPVHIYDLVTSQLNRALRIKEMQETADLVAAAEVILPSDFLASKSAYINVGTRRVPLKKTELDAFNSGSFAPGLPRFFADDDDTMFLSPPPDGSYTIKLTYFAQLNALTSETSSNAVLSAHPGVYLYGALMHAAMWAKDVELSNTYATLFGVEVEALNKSDFKNRFSGRLVHKRARRLS